MKYLAIIAILICSIVSLAASRYRNTRPPAVPLWTQPESWQKLEKRMTSQQVQKILGTPANQKKVAAGMIVVLRKNRL